MRAESPASEAIVQVRGAAVYCEQYGSGAPLILLHGGLVSGAMWQPLLPHLVDAFRVIVPDSRGHGRSTNPSGTLSYPQLADDVAALCEALRVHRPTVVGYSDGGQVALELGVRHPDLADALIVGGAHPDFDATGLRESARAVFGTDDANSPDLSQLDANLGDFAGIAKSCHPGGEEQWRMLVRQTAPMWIDYAGLTPDALRRITARLLLFVGDRDEAVGLEHVVSLYRTLPTAELAVLPHADHLGPITPQRARLVAEVIRDFAARRHAGQ